MTATAPLKPIGKVHGFLIDPHYGWIPVFALSLIFGLGVMFFDGKSVLVLLFACLLGIGLERTTYPLPKTFGTTTRVLAAVKKGLWFGVLFSMITYYKSDGVTNNIELVSKAAQYGGMFMAFNLILPLSEPPKYNGLFEKETVLDQGGSTAAIVLAWPFVTLIGGLLLLYSVSSPLLGGVFVAFMMSLTPRNRVPALNGRNVKLVFGVKALRLALIFSLPLAIYWFGIGN